MNEREAALRATTERVPAGFIGSRRAALVRGTMLPQLLRFAVIGFGQMAIDTAVVYATRAELGLYGAGILAFFVAATPGWALNRAWTFADRVHAPAHRQLPAFLAGNGIGFLLNRGIYAASIALSPFCARNPVFAIAAGSTAGLVNFTLSRQIVFRETRRRTG